MDSAAGPVKHERLTTANNRAGFMDIMFLQTASGDNPPKPSQRVNSRQHTTRYQPNGESGSGQSRLSDGLCGMTALARLSGQVRVTTLCRRSATTALMQRSKDMRCLHRALFNHLVGELLQIERHLEAKHLGGREVDDEIELRGPLDRQVAR